MLLNEIQNNDKFREVALKANLHAMSNIPSTSLDNWIKLISLIHNQTKQRMFFKFFKLYENLFAPNNSKRKLMRDLNERLQNRKFFTGGKRTRKNKRKIIKNKKRSRKHK